MLPLITPAEYQCPGEEHAITRSVHLARLAAFYPKCQQCRHCEASNGIEEMESEDIPPESSNSHFADSANQSLYIDEGVRGVYLNQITRNTALELAGALAHVLWRDLPNTGARVGPAVVIAHDDRPFSPDIITGVSLGLRRMGCRVIDVGLTTRPCFWFAVDHLQADGGIHVTGSGGDPAWTGMDFVSRGATPCSRGGELDRIEAAYQEGYGRPSRSPGSQRMFQAQLPYEAGLWKHFHALRPLRIALGCPSRLVRDVLQRLSGKLACRLLPVEVPIRNRDSANIHDPDVRRVAECVVAEQAHLGMLVEEDGQRCTIFDESGNVVPDDSLTQLLANVVFAEHPGRPALSDLAAQKPSLEQASLAMREQKAVFGSDGHGRYWFHESLPTCDAVLTLAHLLRALSRSDAPLSEVVEMPDFS